MYTEIVHDNIHYFVHTSNLVDHTFDLTTTDGKLKLLQFSDFAIEHKNNLLIKSRANVVDLVRTHCKHHGR